MDISVNYHEGKLQMELQFYTARSCFFFLFCFEEKSMRLIHTMINSGMENKSNNMKNMARVNIAEILNRILSSVLKGFHSLY